MSSLVIDSSAWIEYFGATSRGRVIRERIQGEKNILITGVIITEVLVKHLKAGLPTEQVVTALSSLSRMLPFDIRLSQETAKVYVEQRKKQGKFGLADAHIVALARLNAAKVLTFDTDFTGIPEAIILR